MTCGEAISSAIRKSFQCRGRATRSEYWWFSFAMTLAMIIYFVVLGLVAKSETLAPLLVFLILLPWASVFPLFSLSVRRLHDLNYSGWWFVLYLIISKIADTTADKASGIVVSLLGQKIVIVISLFALVAINGLFLYLFASRGSIGPNNYGPDPLRAHLGEGLESF